MMSPMIVGQETLDHSSLNGLSIKFSKIAKGFSNHLWLMVATKKDGFLKGFKKILKGYLG